MNKKIKVALIGTLLVVGIFDLNPTKLYPLIKPYVPNVPVIIPSEPLLDVEEPSEGNKAVVQDLANLITDKEDKIEIAVLAYEFAKRIQESKYDNRLFETYLEIYVEAGENFHTSGLYDKYGEDFVKELEKIFVSACGGKENVALSNAERLSLSEHFKALAWVLIN